MMIFADVNFIAVIVATILCMGIGFTWYSEKVFGKQWMQLVGVQQKDMTNESVMRAMKIGLVATFIQSLFIAVLMNAVRPTSMMAAIIFGVILWLAVALPIALHNIAWEQRSPKLMQINMGSTLACIVATVIVYQWWPW